MNLWTKSRREGRIIYKNSDIKREIRRRRLRVFKTIVSKYDKPSFIRNKVTLKNKLDVQKCCLCNQLKV